MSLPMLHTPGWIGRFPALRAGYTTRHGGVSKPPFASLNLGKSTDDSAANVAENRRRLCQALGFSPDGMAWSHQVHGTSVRTVDAPGGSEGFDALITDTAGVLLTVSVADCAPILLYDARHNAVAAVHAGWKGTAGQLVAHTLEAMHRAWGTRGADCWALVGACIGPEAFEVGPEVADRFSEAHKRWDPARGKFVVDLKRANADQLRAFGVPDGQIDVSPWCTVQHNGDFFSHRAEHGVTGRMLGFAGLLAL
jgi:YfiH family protein